MPKVSIVVPIYPMEQGEALLRRNLDSIMAQAYRDFEIIVTDDSDDGKLENVARYYPVRYFRHEGPKGMATNTNFGIDQAHGELVKILFQDDAFYNEDSLFKTINHFTPTTKWLVTACTHRIGWEYGVRFDHTPFYSESDNTIGSPSVLIFKRECTARFDPRFTWVLDLDLYKQLYRSYGKPKILSDVTIVIGLHQGQTTHRLTDEYKNYEHQQLKLKYEHHPSVKTVVR